jgi:hypothetical protein
MVTSPPMASSQRDDPRVSLLQTFHHKCRAPITAWPRPRTSMHSSGLVQGDRIVGQLIRAAQAPS